MASSRSAFQSKWVVALSAFVAGAVFGPALGPGLRPTVRRLVKVGIVTQRRLTSVVAGLREDLEDVVAEAEAELASEGEGEPRHPPAAPAPRGAP